MNFRRSCLCISLLAFLAASGAAPVAASDVVLVLPLSSASAFPIMIPNLAEEVCTEPKRAIVECHVIVIDPLKPSPAEEEGPASPMPLAGGNMVITPCGVWDARLTLDPLRLQPASPVFFQEVPGDPGHGVFAVILENRPNLHLTNRETGQTIDFALHPMPGLTGSWAVTTTTESPDPVLGRVITFKNCIPQWVYTTDGYKVIPEEGCEPCPDVTPASEQVEEETG